MSWPIRKPRWISMLVVGGLALLLLLGTAGAQEPPTKDGAAVNVRQKQLEERDRLKHQYYELWRDGETEKAIQALIRFLELTREVYGVESEEVVSAIRWLAACQEARGDLTKARQRLEEALQIRTKQHGTGHWQVADARRAIEDLNLREGLTPEERRQLGEARSLASRAKDHKRARRYAKAEPLYRQALEIRKQLLGENHPYCATSLNSLALLYQSMGMYAKAEPLYHKAVDIEKKALGVNHPSYATTLNNLAELYQSMGMYAKAEPLYHKAVDIKKKALGVNHPGYATTLNNLAGLYERMGDYSRAETLCLQAMEIRRKTLGEEHPRYATTLNNLAELYESMGEYATAKTLCRQALEIRRKTLGEEHRDYATSLNNLAVLCRLLGEYARAETFYQQAMRIDRKALGEKHPDYAIDLNNLGMLYLLLGDYAKAEPLLQRALDIQREAFGEEHVNNAGSLSNLAYLHETMGDYSRAETLYLQAMAIDRNALGKQHTYYATDLGSLARLYASMGEYAKAEPLFQRALDIQREAVGEEHVDYARSLRNLAQLHRSMGEYAKAESLYARAMHINRKALGEEHPRYATVLNDLAMLYGSMGEFARARPLCRQALGIRRKLLDATFVILSERQQFQMSRLFRGTLDTYLSLSTRTNILPAEAHAPLLAWKGAILARQARVRLRARDPESAELLADLMSTHRRLATLSLSVPGAKQRAAWQRQRKELAEKGEELARALSLRSEAYREVRASERLTPSELQESLPEGVTLIDVMEYFRSVTTVKDGCRTDRRERHLVAFLVPADGEIDRVDLGPAAPIAATIKSWRAGIQRHDPGSAGEKLRKLLWEPLAKRLGETRTILLSPDGALNSLPLVALPGKTSGTYLIEEISVAVIPVPRLLPSLLKRGKQATPKESILVLGDVGYGDLPGRNDGLLAASRSAAGTVTGSLPTFARLDATRGEILAIRDSFETRHEDGEVRVLRRGKATEEAFRREAGKHRWLHLATHGFFAPESLRSALAVTEDDRFLGGEVKVTGYHPGLLSGLALAGANTPPEADGDDGILTALEVASLDLSNVEMAVLSACETGLGEVAEGEGVLGLQRAFQVAGARTTITSLWKVPDVATQLLMQRFYENLWDKYLPKLKALREAQLWLMREGGKRGVAVPGKEPSDVPKRLPPFYWAGFVLSGDWR